jgi:hypothetical protein
LSCNQVAQPRHVGEEGGGAAGVQEDHRLIRADRAAADVVDQAGEGFAAVDRVEEDRLAAGQHCDRLQALGGGDAVAGADVALVGEEVVCGQEPAGVVAEQGRGLPGDARGARGLLGLATAIAICWRSVTRGSGRDQDEGAGLRAGPFLVARLIGAAAFN